MLSLREARRMLAKSRRRVWRRMRLTRPSGALRIECFTTEAQSRYAVWLAETYLGKRDPLTQEIRRRHEVYQGLVVQTIERNWALLRASQLKNGR